MIAVHAGRYTSAARHRTVLEQALDGTEWHGPIPTRPARKANR